jgi:hypothetical protein
LKTVGNLIVSVPLALPVRIIFGLQFDKALAKPVAHISNSLDDPLLSN